MKKILLLLSLNILLFATNVSDFINKHQCDQIIDKKIYTVCYSYKYKGALGGWTVLDSDKVNAVNIKKRPRFYENKTIPKKYRTKYSDYTRMGRTWNRGHFIIADADADYSQKSLHLVYDMSQIQPQASKVNQKTWLKVEKYGRMLATKLGYVHSVTIANYRVSTKNTKVDDFHFDLSFYTQKYGRVYVYFVTPETQRDKHSQYNTYSEHVLLIDLSEADSQKSEISEFLNETIIHSFNKKNFY